MTSFSEWVRGTRRAKNLTLQEVADRAGVKQPVWSQWESGKAVPRRETVIKIADALAEPRNDALLRAGYLPSEAEPTSTRLAERINEYLSQAPVDQRPALEDAVVQVVRAMVGHASAR